MLNDYEISKLSIDKYGKLISILKLIAASLALVCTILLLPSWIEKLESLRAVDDDALKVRVIANSNTKEDQQIKKEVVDSIAPIFFQAKPYNLGRVNEDELIQSTASYLTKQFKQVDFDVKIEDHLTPPKIQQGIFYPQNFYHTLVVKIGEGRGENFWCSLFPDVCKGPSKDDENKEEKEEEKEVKFILWEWIKQLFS